MKRFLIALIILIVGGYFGYKGYLLYEYRDIHADDVSINTKMIFERTIELPDIYSSHTSINSLLNGTYLLGYEKPEDGHFFVLYDDNHKVKSYYLASVMPEYIYDLDYEYEMTAQDKEFIPDEKIKDFLKKNNIKNDIDLLKYIKDNYPCKSNLFSSINKIKNNYMINEFVAIALSTFESIDLIENNYGYIVNIMDNLKEIHLIYDEKQYIITLGGEELTSDAFINSLIGTIVFDN